VSFGGAGGGLTVTFATEVDIDPISSITSTLTVIFPSTGKRIFDTLLFSDQGCKVVHPSVEVESLIFHENLYFSGVSSSFQPLVNAVNRVVTKKPELGITAATPPLGGVSIVNVLLSKLKVPPPESPNQGALGLFDNTSLRKYDSPGTAGSGGWLCKLKEPPFLSSRSFVVGYVPFTY
jgi:hypothetical protein